MPPCTLIGGNIPDTLLNVSVVARQYFMYLGNESQIKIASYLFEDPFVICMPWYPVSSN